MIKVHLNSGTLYKFKKGKVTFGKEHLSICTVKKLRKLWGVI